MNSDQFNPIFALQSQRMLRFLRRPVIVALLIVVFVATVFLLGIGLSSGHEEETVAGFLAIVGLVGLFFAAYPAFVFSGRMMHPDLIHATPLTGRQIITGYVLSSAVTNLLICVAGTLVLAPLLIGHPLFWIVLICSLMIFCGTEAIAICILPYFAIVEKTYHYLGVAVGCFVLSIYAICIEIVTHIAFMGSIFAAAFVFVFLTSAAAILGFYTACDCLGWEDEPFFKKIAYISTRYVLALLVVFGGVWGVLLTMLCFFFIIHF